MDTNETEEQKTRVRAAWLKIERSNGYCHPVLSFGSAEPRDDDGDTYRNAGSLDGYRMRKPYTLDLEDFQVRAQGETEKPGELYGWELEYSKYRVREDDVKGMADTFKSLRRALEKTRAAAGEPGTWADFALRICVALKIERLYVRRPDHFLSEAPHAARQGAFEAERIRDGLAHGERMLWTQGERERGDRAA
jgi:hypothetical protein